MFSQYLFLQKNEKLHKITKINLAKINPIIL